MRHLIAAALLLAGFGIHSAAAQAPELLPKLEHRPAIDGTLGDPAWGRAALFTAFRTLHPEAGRAPSVRTEARLAYDDSTIYVGIRALDQDPATLRPTRGPDDVGSSDWVSFCLDSQGDGIGAYFFLVSPGGARLTGLLDGNGNPIATRALRSTTALRRDAAGYTVTMAIPLAQLPYQSGVRVDMAFKVARFVAARGEESDFPEISPSRPHLAQLDRITLAGLRPSRTADDGYIADLEKALRTKLSRRAQQQYVTLAGRVAGWEGGASALDYRVFPARRLHASALPFHFPVKLETARVTAAFDEVEDLPGRPIGNLDRFLTRTASQSLIVLRNDTVVYEKYFNGYARDSVNTSFSVAKSFAVTLVGIAIDRGLIHGVQDPITDYLPELARRDTLFRRIRIADLLHMTSGLRYVEDRPPHDNDITYLDPDLRRAALEQTAIVEPPGVHWLYNNYNPLLVGMILERATGRSVTTLLQDWIWNPLGMEFGGSWSLDSGAHGFEKMESGLNARAMDFAKLGALALHRGRWRGRQIVSASWIDAATQPRQDPPGFYSDQAYFGAGGHYYGYFWWGSRRPDGPSDFFALGNKGEFIYCSPQKRLVIVRTGMRFGISSSAWVRLFRAFADRFDTPAAARAAYFPTRGWRRSSPEAQGMDSRALADAFEYVRQRNIPIHSLLIVRNGYLVLDAYFWPFADGELHDVASVTKSVTSTLVGMAIGQGKLSGLDQPVLPLFGLRAIAHRDRRKDGITLEHLLTMTAGLDCHVQQGEITLSQMMASPDWIRFMLDLPMIAEPGDRFSYCSGGMHLLSGALSRATGASAFDYARRELLGPLGITDAVWPPDPQGITRGWGDLHLQPRDMAKLGYLWLNGGRWENRQLVPGDWLRSASRVHAHPGFTPGQEYGYGFWIYPNRTPPEFEALGRGGQRISVIPARNLVVVFTGGEFEPGDIGQFIGRAIRGDRPLPENPAAAARLAAAIQRATLPPPARAIPPAPALAGVVSGRTYVLEANPLDLRSFTLTFPGGGEARLELQLPDRRDGPRPLGLDGVPRVSPAGRFGLPVALSGAWENDSTFVLDYDEVGNINHYRFRLLFAGAGVTVELAERSGARVAVRFHGVAQR